MVPPTPRHLCTTIWITLGPAEGTGRETSQSEKGKQVQWPRPSGSMGARPWDRPEGGCRAARRPGRAASALLSACLLTESAHPVMGHGHEPWPRASGLPGELATCCQSKLQKQLLRSPGGWRPPRLCAPGAHSQKGPGSPALRPGLSHQEPGPGGTAAARAGHSTGHRPPPSLGVTSGADPAPDHWRLAMGGRARAPNGQLSSHSSQGCQPGTAPTSEDTPALSGVPEGQRGL